MGLRLSDLSNLLWCFTLPRLESFDDLDAFARVLDQTRPGVVFLDNTTLCMPGDKAGVVMAMGQIFVKVIQLCSERDITPVFIHHFKRTRTTADPYAPGELADLTQAGAAEIAGQWWLLTRRERFDPDQPGEHKLWLSVGGRVGHSSLHGLDIHEGRRSDPGGRRWEVDIFEPHEIRQTAEEQSQTAKTEQRKGKMAVELEANRREIVDVMIKLGRPETKNGMRAHVSCGHSGSDRAFTSLIRDGTLEAVQTEKGNGQNYPAWRLRSAPEV